MHEWNFNALLSVHFANVSSSELPLLVLAVHFRVMFFSEIRRPLPCDVEHDVCKHVDEIVTWLCSMSCAMENQARAKRARRF